MTIESEGLIMEVHETIGRARKTYAVWQQEQAARDEEWCRRQWPAIQRKIQRAAAKGKEMATYRGFLWSDRQYRLMEKFLQALGIYAGSYQIHGTTQDLEIRIWFNKDWNSRRED